VHVRVKALEDRGPPLCLAAPCGLYRLREAVRAYAVDPAHRYETVVGNVGFDQNGDSIQQFVTFYHVEASAAGGTGDCARGVETWPDPAGGRPPRMPARKSATWSAW